MDDYFSLENQNRFMSVSQYKKFARCPAAAMAELNGEWKQPMTQALLSGQYVDAYVEGRLEEFIDKHPEMISTRGQTAGHLKAEYRALNALIDRFESDLVFVEYLAGEKTAGHRGGNRRHYVARKDRHPASKTDRRFQNRARF